MKNIVILGAGFGGIRTALELNRKLCMHAREIATPLGGARNDDEGGWRVIIVDRNPFHIYYPKLFEEVVPSKLQITNHKSQNCVVLIEEILKGTQVEFLQGTIESVDCKGRTVEVTPSPPPSPTRGEGELSKFPSPFGRGEGEGVRKIGFDYLVLALGAEADYFGIPGLKEYAVVLRSVDDAAMIRGKVTNFLKSHNPSQPPSPGLRPPSPRGRGEGEGQGGAPFSIVIGGAGATGVELAAGLAHAFRAIEKSKWSVTIVEALANVLWMFPNGVSQYAHTRLEKLGVKLMLDTCMKSVEARPSPPPSPTRGEGDRRAGESVEVVLTPRPLGPGENENELVCDFLPEHEKRVRPDLLIWTGGVRANALLASCGMTVDHKGRLEVDEHLQVKGMDRVFAIGDNAFLMDPQTKQPVPGTAQVALAEAEIVARNVVASIRGKTLALYTFPTFPAIVPLAGRDGVAFVGERVISGLSAWILRHAADCRYFASIVGWRKAVRRCIIK